MSKKKLSKECKDCLKEMYTIEEELEKAYAEENDILITKLLSDLEEINEKYVVLREKRAE